MSEQVRCQKTGIEQPVRHFRYTYTNADEVELFVNGKSLGVKNDVNDPKVRDKIKWDNVAYESGSIEAGKKEWQDCSASSG